MKKGDCYGWTIDPPAPRSKASDGIAMMIRAFACERIVKPLKIEMRGWADLSALIEEGPGYGCDPYKRVRLVERMKDLWFAEFDIYGVMVTAPFPYIKPGQVTGRGVTVRRYSRPSMQPHVGNMHSIEYTEAVIPFTEDNVFPLKTPTDVNKAIMDERNSIIRFLHDRAFDLDWTVTSKMKTLIHMIEMGLHRR